jgi:hypothetical protein
VVHLYRTLNFQDWTESNPSPFMFPSEDDAQVSPFSDFPSRALYRGLPENAFVGVPNPGPRMPFSPWWEGKNWSSWVRNSNDGDMCCLHANVTTSYLVFGASTQGRAAGPPLNHTAEVNAVGTADMPLHELLAKYFQ